MKFRAFFAASILYLLFAPQSFAQGTIACWYNAAGTYTGSDSYQGVVGTITRTGSGDYAAGYLISAYDGRACPRTLPASAVSGSTAYLVKQDFSDCANGNVAATPSNTGGSVTIFRLQDGSEKIAVRFDRAAPNTAYHFFHKCVRLLGNVTTDANGDGAGLFSISLGRGQRVTFDSYPEGAPAGNKYQSVRMNF